MTEPYGNFIEETSTGTGDTQALAGATSGNIQFQEKFADGEAVRYVIEDSAGVIRVGGIGLYVSATDDITRNDTWSWNGTTYSDDPNQTNITLGGGTHTIRCDVLEDDFNTGGVIPGRIYMSATINELSSTFDLTADDRIAYIPLKLEYSGFYDEFAIEVTSTGTNIKMGLYDSRDGLPNSLLVVHDTNFSVGTTGLKAITFDGGSIYLKKGHYFVGIVNDAQVVLRASFPDSVIPNQLGTDVMGSTDGVIFKTLTFANMPDPADITGLTFFSNGPSMGITAT